MPSPWRTALPAAGIALTIALWFLRTPAPELNRLTGLLALVAAGFVLFFFRSESLVYGDGLTILTVALPNEPMTFQDQFGLQALSLLLNRGAVLVFGAVGLEPIDALGLWKVLGGMAMVGAVYRLTDHFFTSTQRLAATLLTLTGGATLLAFGHIENYTWPLAMILWSLTFQLTFLKTGRLGWVAVGTALAAAALHLIALPILVTAVLALLKRGPGRIVYAMNGSLLFVLMALSSALLVLAANMVVTRSPFVPLWPVDGNPYWFLSSAHLLDLCNLLLMMSPLAIVALVGRLTGRLRLADNSALLRQLMIVAFGFGLIAFWVDPLIGAPRDWDLLALFAIPTNVVVVYSLAKSAWSPLRRPLAILPVTVVFLAPYVWLMNDADASVRRLHALLLDDMHYTEAYDKANRCLSWGVIVDKFTERRLVTLPYFQRRLRAEPTSYSAAGNIGEHFSERNRFDSAAYYYTIAHRLAPRDVRFASNLAIAYGNIGRLDEALALGRQAIQLDREFPLAHTAVGIALARKGAAKEAMPYFQRAYQLKPTVYDYVVNLGIGFAHIGLPDSSARYLGEALNLAPRPDREKLLVELVFMHQQMGDPTTGRRFEQMLKSEFPQSTLLEELRRR